MDVAASLKWQGAGAAVSEIGTKRLTRLLLAVEIALAIVLLVGAGIVGRTFWNLYTAPLGVNTSNVLIMRLPLPPPKYARLEAGVAFHDQLLTRLQSVSGVQAVASGAVPTGGSLTVPYELEGAAPVPAQQRPSLSVVIISPDYFKVWDVPLLRGRFFTGGDRAGSPPVVMVNQAFADTVWPGGDPLAKRLRLYRGAPGSWLTVVGVVAKIVHNDVFPRQLDPVIYLPFDQRPFPGITIMARTLVPPASLSDTFRREVRAIDPDMPILGVTTMAQRLEQNYWLQRIRGSLFAIFACVALLLAAAGLHVVIADTVRQRTYEIGVRMAMGAHARDIWRLVLGETVLYLAVGVAIGVAAAFALMRGLQSVLVGVSPADPGSFAAACAAWMIAMALGCIVPLRRALRLDPVVALRHE